MPLLQGILQLHDVGDTEALAAKALTDQLRATRATLSGQEREDAVSYLIGVAWEASLSYDPSLSPSFSQFAYRRCRLRTVDWYRCRFGDTRFGGQEKRDFLDQLSLDAPARGADDDFAGGTLGEGLAARPDDREGDSVSGLRGWLQHQRAGERAWRAEVASAQLADRAS